MMFAGLNDFLEFLDFTNGIWNLMVTGHYFVFLIIITDSRAVQYKRNEFFKLTFCHLL